MLGWTQKRVRSELAELNIGVLTNGRWEYPAAEVEAVRPELAAVRHKVHKTALSNRAALDEQFREALAACAVEPWSEEQARNWWQTRGVELCRRPIDDADPTLARTVEAIRSDSPEPRPSEPALR
mgnify:CR=1 FL=1